MKGQEGVMVEEREPWSRMRISRSNYTSYWNGGGGARSERLGLTCPFHSCGPNPHSCSPVYTLPECQEGMVFAFSFVPHDDKRCISRRAAEPRTLELKTY